MKKLIILLLASTLAFISCQKDDNNDDDKTATLLALLQLQNQSAQYAALKSSILEIEGYYYTGYFSSGNLVASTTSDLTISADSSGKTGSWTDVTSFGDTVRRIIEYDNTNNTLYYQQTPNGAFNKSKYGKIIWMDKTTECEGKESPCFYYCEIVFGKDTLAEVKADTTTANSATPKNSGSCGVASWNMAFPKTDTSSWQKK